MPCNITRNSFNEPVSVTLESGQQSQLFNKLLLSPIVDTENSALDLYKSVLGEGISELSESYPAPLVESTGEPVLIYKTTGNYFTTSLRKALNVSQDGIVEAGFLNPNISNSQEVQSEGDVIFPLAPVVYRTTNLFTEGKLLNDSDFVSVAYYSNPSVETPKGILLEAVKDSVVAENRVVNNGRAYYVGEGQAFVDMTSNGMAAISALQANPYTTNVTNNHEFSLFRFDTFDMNQAQVGDLVISIDEFEERLQSGEREVREDFNFTANLYKLAIQRGYRIRPVSSDNASNIIAASEEQLTNRVIEQFSRLGVGEEVINNVREFFDRTNGQELTVEQLNSAVNELLQLSRQQSGAVSETVASIIVEDNTESVSLSNAMVDVLSETEYSEVKPNVESSFGNTVSSLELENMVRKTAVKKVVERSMSNEKVYPSTLTTSVSEMVSSTTNKVSQNTNQQTFSDLYDLNQDVESFTYTKKVGDTTQNSNKDGILYAPEYQTSEFRKMENTILALKERLASSNSSATILSNLDDASISANMWDAAVRVASAAQSETEFLAREIQGSLNKGANVSVEGERAYSILKTGIMPLISDLIVAVESLEQSSPLSTTETRRLKDALRSSTNSFASVEGYYNKANSRENFRQTVLRELYDYLNWDAETSASFEKALWGEQKDLNIILGSIGSLANRHNPILQVGAWVVGQVFSKAKIYINNNVTQRVNSLLQRGAVDVLPELVENDANGNPTEYLTSPLRLREGLYDRAQHIKNLRTELLRLTPEQIASVQTEDDATQLVRNILVEILSKSSLSDRFGRTATGLGTIRLTEQEYQEALTALRPSLAQLNSIYNTQIEAELLLARPGGLAAENLYYINRTPLETIDLMFDDMLDARSLQLNKRQLAQYNLRMIEYDRDNREMMFTEEYYQQELDYVNDPANNGVEFALMAQKDLNSQAGQILSKYKIPGQGVDMSALRADLADGAKLRQIENTRRHMRNPYKIEQYVDEFGEQRTGAVLKPFITESVEDGRRVFRAQNLTPQQIESMDYDDLVTWGMIRISERYRDNARESGRDYSQDFINRVLELEQTSNLDAYDFLRYNGAIGLNEQFYQDRGDYQSYIDRVRTQVNAMPEGFNKESAQRALAEYDMEFRNLRYYNNVNRSVTNIGEVDYSGKDIEMEQVRSIEERLKILRQQLPALEDDITTQSTMEKGVTESYVNDLRAKGIEEWSEQELDFILTNHLIDKEGYYRFLNALKDNQRYGIPLRNYYAPYLIRARQAGVDNVIQRAQLEYLKDHLPSYYTRYTPQGFNELMRELREGTVAPSILINPETAPERFQNIVRYIQINPRYDWRESLFNEENLNPRYQQGGQTIQLKRSKWINNNYFERFGINPNGYLAGTESDYQYDSQNVSEFQATQNQSQFQILRDVTDIRRQSLELKGMQRQVSPYRLPRISRSTLEKFRALTTDTRSSIREWIQDFGTYRVDETDAQRDATGKIIVGAGEMRTIPRYFETELEDPSTLSRDYMGMIVRDVEQASLYKYRKEAETQMLATLNQVELQQFKNGVRGESSNTMSRLKEYSDAMFYGKAWNMDVKFKIGNKVVYLSKALGNFNKLFSNTNLAFNPFVDITGATTAATTRLLMSRTEEYFAQSSLSFANRRADLLSAELMKDYGQLNQSAELIRLMETFGVRTLGNRVESTNFSRGARLVKESAFLGSEISNLTNTSRLVITLLKDHRLVNGRFVNYNEFSRLPENSQLTRAEIRTAFNAISEQSLYDLATFENGIQFNDGVEVAQNEADRLQVGISQKISALIETTDGVIARESRTWMQRNPLFKLMTTHKGWLSLGIDRRFKGEQHNLRTNRREAGHYYAVGNLILQAYRETGTLNPFKLKEAIADIASRPGNSEIYGTYSRYVTYETILTMLMTAIGVGVLAATEDDDNEDLWALQFGGLIYLRTLSELNSISLLGLPGAVKDTFEKPFVSADFVSRFFNLDNMSLEEVRSGKYKGLPKIWAQLMKLTVGKRFYDAYNIRETNRAYRHWNGDTLPFLRDNGFVDSTLLPWLDPNTFGDE